jgi:hypothetical protein
MTGIAGVIANDSARWSLFWSCWDDLMLPDGWRKEKLIGGDWCGARNTLVEMTLATDAEYLMFMDDDHAFRPDLIHLLLRHDLPLVVPACLTRSAPFPPVAFTEQVDEDRYLPVYLPEREQDELVPLVAAGTAGMLIHRSVLEAMEPPWFEYGFASEDILFCNKARDLGFTPYVDLSVRIGHMTSCVVEPAYVDGQWVVGARIGSYGAMTSMLLPIEHAETEVTV